MRARVNAVESPVRDEELVEPLPSTISTGELSLVRATTRRLTQNFGFVGE
jgi:hypothetical protein